jgi:branched-subunit amino acid transport protein
MSISLPIIAYILVMAGVTYLIRMTPFVLFRKKITSQFVRSLLYYLPYCVLSAMVIPSVFASTGSFLTALCGLTVAVILAFCNRSLLTVAVGASAAAWLSGLAFSWIL